MTGSSDDVVAGASRDPNSDNQEPESSQISVDLIKPFQSEDAAPDDPKNCRYTSQNSGIWDTLFFGYLTGVILRGIRSQLEARDLKPLHTSFSTEETSERITRLWKQKISKRMGKCQNEETPPDSDDRRILVRREEIQKPINMISLMGKAFWSQLLLAHTLYLGTILAAAVPPFLIGELADFIGDKSRSLESGLYIAGALFVSQQLHSLLFAHCQGILYNVSFKLQSGFSSAIYQKCLRLSPSSTKEHTTGDIVNLISVDLENVKKAVVSSYSLWGAPFTLIFTHVLIYQYMGVYSLAGALAILLFAPVVGLMIKLEGYLQEKQMEKKDARADLISEVFNNIKVIKLYAWENSFVKRIRSIRVQECRIMYKFLAAWNIVGFTWYCYPFFVSAASIAAYMFLNKDEVINPKIVLVTIAYFNSMRNDFIMFPISVSDFVKARVSAQRIRAFLEAEEVDPEAIKDDLEADEEISFKNATVTWTEDEGPVLKNVNLSVRKGELVAVVGAVAAGKSSLIQAIAGELSPTCGSISRRKSCRVAYVPQQAWILNDTIRNNILFGSSLEPGTYREVVSKCCLLPDLKILPAGDATEIGEKGVNLSGGQKQRVSLARAAYQNADIYLLDDPLSAVDAHVSLDLFNGIIGPEGILRSTTRVLVTHSVAVLPHVDRIIVLENGEVTHQGTYEDIMRENIRLKELVETHSRAEEEDATPRQSQLSSIPRERAASISGEVSGVERQMSEIPSGRLIDEEEMEVGKVRFRVYAEFIWRFGILGTLLIIGGYSVARVANFESLFYLADFSKEIDEKNGTTKAIMWEHMQIYLAYGGVNSFGMLLGLFTLTVGCIWTSTSLHNRMLDAVLRAPMSFFDSTPTGRILNRFSRDVDELDLGLYGGVDGYAETWILLIVSATWICIKLPIFLSVMIPLLLMFLAIERLYMASSRQFRRLDAVTRSPVLNCFNESLAGTSSIRAYGVQNNFIHKHMRLLDNNQNCIFHEFIGYRWLEVRLDFLGSMIDFGVCCMLLYFRKDIESEVAALIFSISLQASTAFCSLVTFGTQFENSLVSAERVLDYLKTKPEAPWFVEGDADPSWPQRGEVRFENYSTRYRADLDLVLKRIDLQLNAGEKIGVVGRTGAGKSSLTLALLRIIEATEGKILIDGLDIAKLGLNTLRSRLAIIPQDPVLFQGTLRENVDPEGKFSDEQIWAALERAHLKSENKPITYKVDEGGSNLSVGERQLVCLARALLRNSKLLILDEATAAVDLETDSLIQDTIRQDFKGSTVITIAHRLHTIMDYDKIVVLDEGKVLEMGSPRSLLEDAESAFSRMAEDANIRLDT